MAQSRQRTAATETAGGMPRLYVVNHQSSCIRQCNGKAITLCEKTTNTPIFAQLAGLPIGLILDGSALLNDVGKARLIERQQAIFQHCDIVLFERRQRFSAVTT